MYYPKQVPFLLDKEFCNYINYKEYILEDLTEYVMCIWTMSSKCCLNKSIPNNILPDACIDIVINFTDRWVAVAGFSKETEPFMLQEKVDYMGVRLKPGAFYAIFNVSAYKAMDNMISFANLDKDYEIDAVFKLNKVVDRIAFLEEYLKHKISNNLDNTYILIADKIYDSPKDLSVGDIALSLGLSKKQLYREFIVNYGVSPKVLLNILRLHLCLTLLLDKKMALIDVANLCGFYDQAHFIKTIKRYTSISPLKFSIYNL